MSNNISGHIISFAIVGSLPVLLAVPSHAVTVTVNSLDYDVTFFDGSYDNNTSLFQVPPAGQMPWWGDSSGSLASEFALQVYDKLGIGPTPGYGPLFAYQFVGADLESVSQNLTDPSSQNLESTATSVVSKYAIAVPLFTPPTQVPSPLPVIGIFAAYTTARRLRLRTKSASESLP